MDILIPKNGLGYSRNLLPQIGQKYHEFIEYLDKHDIDYAKSKVYSRSLKATQADFDTEKVAAIMASTKKKNATIIVSNDNHILDGHHNWLAAWNKSEDISVLKVDLSIFDLIALGKRFAAENSIEYKDIENTDRPRDLLSTIKEMVNEKVKMRNKNIFE
jgi:hypothetical protein